MGTRALVGRIVTLIIACVAALGCGSGGDGSTAPDANTPDAGVAADAAAPDGGIPMLACNRPAAEQAPVWTAGHHYPRFPAASGMYVLPGMTDLHDQTSSWRRSWRITDSPDTMYALTLVGMQGVINRETPCVYFTWYDPQAKEGTFWASQVADHVTVEQVNLEGAAAVDFLYRRFTDRFAGAVIYDPQVPDTINVATMLAGLENRVMLAPDQVGQPGVPTFADTTDLRDLVASQHWEPTEDGKTRLYQWVYDNLWPRLDHRLIGLISPGPPTSLQIPGNDPDYFGPLALAQRDYLIATNAPALWLAPDDGPEGTLFGKFLDDAGAGVPVSGFFGAQEPGTVSFVTRHGDTDDVFTNTNSPLMCANMSALAGVPVTAEPFVPRVDPDRILATLGTAPVTALWSSDGDGLGLQFDRGYWNEDPNRGFDWESVQGHRFSWTANANLADLAPLVWNYYIDSADQVGLVAGFSGAGYVFPELFDAPSLATYLQDTARLLDETGLRVIYASQSYEAYRSVAKAYHDQLSGSGYLGAFFGFGPGPWGLTAVWDGVPSPGVAPAYYTPDSNGWSADAILADLPGRTLGRFTVEIPDFPLLWLAPGEVVDDSAAPGGRAFKLAADLTTNGPLAFSAGPLHLLPGSYTVTLPLKVADNSSANDVAAFLSGTIASDGSWNEIVLHSVKASDFSQAGKWQNVTATFTLPTDEESLFLRVLFFSGTTDVYLSQIEVTREGVDPLPFFAPILMQAGPDHSHDAPALAESLAAAGVVVLTPDELMAALNPEYMITLAEERLGASNSGVMQARAKLEAGQFLDALMTVRAALAAQ